MSQTAARLLGLLSLLMVPRTWSGTDLAERLNVSSRTVRSDIGLHSGLSCIIGGMEETSAQALAKLEQILPSPVRNRVKNLAHFTVPLAGNHPMPIVDPNLLTLIIEYCHGHQRFRFTYRPEIDADPDRGEAPPGQEDDREFEVEPYRLVNHQHRWYLLTFDPAEKAWAIFRVERIVPKLPGGRRFEPRDLPAQDIGTYVEKTVSASRWRHTSTVTVHATALKVMKMLMPAEGTVEALDEQRSTVMIGAETLSTMALTLARLDVEFTVEDSPQLLAELRSLSHRLLRATTSSGRQ